MSSPQTPRILQPQQEGDEQQRSTASGESQPAASAGTQQPQQEMGEGSYEGTREYNKRTKEYLKKGDVEKDAQAAKPRSEQEARDMERAEDEGRSHSKGER